MDMDTAAKVPVEPRIMGQQGADRANCAGVEILPQFLKKVSAKYSKVALMAQADGKVILEVRIGQGGEILDAHVYVSLHPLVNRAALDACLASRFRPALDNCEPVESVVHIAYDFVYQEFDLPEHVIENSKQQGR